MGGQVSKSKEEREIEKREKEQEERAFRRQKRAEQQRTYKTEDERVEMEDDDVVQENVDTLDVAFAEAEVEKMCGGNCRCRLGCFFKLRSKKYSEQKLSSKLTFGAI